MTANASQPNLETQFSRQIQKLEASRAQLQRKTVALLNILEDLEAERLRSEQNERQFQALFQSISDGILVINLENRRFSLVNDAACRILGYDMDEFQSLSYQVIHPRYIHSSSRMDFSGDSVNDLVTLRRKDGTEFLAEIRYSRYQIGETDYLVSVFQDITERMAVEASLRKREREISLLYDAGRKLSSTLDLQVIYDHFYKIVSQVMDCVALYISSYDPDTRLIRCLFAVQDGVRLDVTNFPPIPLAENGKGTQSLVIHSGRPLNLRDYLSQRKSSPNYYRVTKDGILDQKFPEDEKVTRSALIVPMLLDGKVLGVIQVFSYEENAYSDDDLHFLEALGLQTAAAIHNALIYERAQIEIAERNRAEEALREREDELRASLAEKEVLLREIHHRVKNNLEVVISLADMQARQLSDPVAFQSIRELQERVRTIALVHEDLYHSHNMALIQAQSFLIKLTDNLFQVFGSAGIDLEVDAADLSLDIEVAIPLGLIVTELLTNAIKHAFPGREDLPADVKAAPNRIRVAFYEAGEEDCLEVCDNGAGLAPDFDWRSTRSLGLRMVNRLAEQLHGSLSLIPADGAYFQLRFPKCRGGVGSGE